ncbi:hypothetical protein CK203_103362 [Vitis vinifera]|uniref:Uncharacterized protein n=1 Tax=Vitis vinifera TaxID=29760 RepID=A0A438DMZ3_VITVI|nr:hypothetical protein CK203_103362 [Vitis vinifera]
MALVKGGSWPHRPSRIHGLRTLWRRLLLTSTRYGRGFSIPFIGFIASMTLPFQLMTRWME